MQIQVPASPTSPGASGNKAATVRRWLKKEGEAVRAGDVVVELETEDAIVALAAGGDGVLARIVARVGKTVAVGGELGVIEAGGVVGAGGGSKVDMKSKAEPPAGGSPTGTPDGGVPIMMPQAGNTMEEGTILKWKVKVGETIAVGQVICEVETDKATVEIEATAAGKVGWLAAEGSVVAVKQPILLLGDVTMAAASAAAGEAVAAVASDMGGGKSGVQQSGLGEGVVPVLMPQAGNTMEEGTILKWRVKVGDRVTVGQVMCDIETDKASIEFEATDAGRVAKIVAAEGAVVPVKQAIAYLAENDAAVAGLGGVQGSGRSTTQEAGSKKQEAGSTKQEVGSAKEEAGRKNKEVSRPVERAAVVARMNGGRVKASPAARKLAAERGIDLALVGAGSGPEGRILSTDLMHVKAGVRAVAAPVAATTTAAGGKGPASAGAKEILAAGPMGALSGGRKAMSKMRKAIAVNLQTSKQTVPHFYVKLTIQADPLFSFYRAQKPATGCTLNDVILLAVGRCVGEFAAFRSRLEGNEIVETASANIGVAVSVLDGLVVPVVMGIHGLTLGQLATEAKRVVEAARNGKIENMGKGVFTISNMGMLGVEDFSAIINPPESGILAVSGVREAVIVKDGAMRAGRVMAMTLSVDHRVVDGALAAQWMGRLRELLENPEKLL